MSRTTIRIADVMQNRGCAVSPQFFLKVVLLSQKSAQAFLASDHVSHTISWLRKLLNIDESAQFWAENHLWER